jgi:stearoyl-CoA desaturase (delta-9 desaturase)
MMPTIADRLKDTAHKLSILALVVIPLAGVIVAMRMLWHRAAGWDDVALMIGLYVPISMGITVGFHRYLTHRGFRAGPLVKATLLVLGSMAVEGSAIAWAANHRKHHALSDREGDPHSPADGFFHAHVGWLFDGQVADQVVYARDLRADRMVMWISRTWPLWAAMSLVIPFLVGGWSGLLWGGLVRIFLTHHVTWSVNSVCHTFGKRPYQTKDRSRNQWVVGLLALGEGWHNNHHAFPRSALHGLRWWQFDLSGITIRLLERLRLIWNVQRVSPDDVRARDERRTVDAAA